MALIPLPGYSAPGGPEQPSGSPGAPNVAGASSGGYGSTPQTVQGPNVSPGVGVNPGDFLDPINQAGRAEDAAAREMGRVASEISGTILNQRQIAQENTALALKMDLDGASQTAFNVYLEQMPQGDPSSWGKEWQERHGKQFYERWLKGVKGKVNRGQYQTLELYAKRQLLNQTAGLQRESINRQARIDYNIGKTRYDQAIAEGRTGDARRIAEEGGGRLFSEDEVSDMVWRADRAEYYNAGTRAIMDDPRGEGEAFIRQFEAGTGSSSAERFVDMVKEFEGFNENAYGDESQTSIGYGTRGRPGEKITKEEADTRLRSELDEARESVMKIAAEGGYEFNQNQLDALTSFQFNTGDARQLLIENGQRTNDEIANKMLEYTRGEQSGTVYPGLVTRRQRESQLFRKSGDSIQAAKFRKLQAEAVETHRGEELQFMADEIDAEKFLDDDDFYKALEDMAFLEEQDRADLIDRYNGSAPGTGRVLDLSTAIDVYVSDPSTTELDTLRLKSSIAAMPTWAQSYLRDKMDIKTGDGLSPQKAAWQKQGEGEVSAILRGVWGSGSLGPEEAVLKERTEWAAKSYIHRWMTEEMPDGTRHDFIQMLDDLKVQIDTDLEAHGFIQRVWGEDDGVDIDGLFSQAHVETARAITKQSTNRTAAALKWMEDKWEAQKPSPELYPAQVNPEQSISATVRGSTKKPVQFGGYGGPAPVGDN